MAGIVTNKSILNFFKKLQSYGDSWFLFSPFFAVYGATKAALKFFIESVNVELLKSGSPNFILNVSPGTIKGSAFYGKENDQKALHELTCEILHHLEKKDDLYIP